MSPGNNSKKPDSSESGFLLPAVQAALIQCVSLLILYLLLQGAWMCFGWQTTLGIAAILQGGIAAVLSYWRRLPYWWIAIQFGFPLTLLVAYAVGIPSWVFFLCFLGLVLVYWTPFRTRVPLFLSGQTVRDKVVELLSCDRPIRFLDAGSGLGGMALHVAERCPNVEVTGIELAPIPWLISCLRRQLRRNPARIAHGRYERLNFSDFDVVFAYLSPAAMKAFWQKASTEMHPGAWVLSYEFQVPDVSPDFTVDFQADGTVLYAWRIPGISQKQDSPLQFPSRQL